MTGKRLSRWDMEDSAWDAGNAIIRSAHLERRHKVRPSRVTLEQAQELFKTCMPVRKKEEKQSADCLGQILAKPGYAAVTQPPFPRSAMDGFALRSRDICRADIQHPVTLEVTGCVCAGQETEFMLKPHQAVRIMTGSMIPEGADCVVKQEDAEWDERAVRIYHNAKLGFAGTAKAEAASMNIAARVRNLFDI